MSHPDPTYDATDYEGCAEHEQMYRQWEEHMIWLEETAKQENDDEGV